MNEEVEQVYQNINEAHIFTSTVTNQVDNINHKFNISDKCLIYLLTCKKCLTRCLIHLKQNNYKNNSRDYDCNLSCSSSTLYELHSSVGACGCLEHVSITFIEKTDASDLETYTLFYGTIWSKSFIKLIMVHNKLKGFLFFRILLPDYVISAKYIGYHLLFLQFYKIAIW